MISIPKLKVMTIVGTRPEIIRLSRPMALLDKYTQQIIVHTGQNYDYELNEVFWNDLEIRKPDHFLNVDVSSLGATVGDIMRKSEEVMLVEKPDAVLILGDTNSCLAAYIAKRLRIPIFHMEAGNRSFDFNVPEEINRRIIDHIADFNLVYTEHARRHLISEGLMHRRIYLTGSPMREVLIHYQLKIKNSTILETLQLNKNGYFVVSVHREENVDYADNFNNLLNSLNVVAEKFNKRVIVSTHPRTRKKLESLGPKEFNSKVEFMKPMGFFDYNKLQKDAYCVISDSGTITEESSFLKFPAIMIRQAHERPEGMDVGLVVMSGLSPERVVDSINMMVSQFEKYKPLDVEDYSSDRVSDQVVKIIQSYTDYVNRVVWRKNI